MRTSQTSPLILRPNVTTVYRNQIPSNCMPNDCFWQSTPSQFKPGLQPRKTHCRKFIDLPVGDLTGRRSPMGFWRTVSLNRHGPIVGSCSRQGRHPTQVVPQVVSKGTVWCEEKSFRKTYAFLEETPALVFKPYMRLPQGMSEVFACRTPKMKRKDLSGHFLEVKPSGKMPTGRWTGSQYSESSLTRYFHIMWHNKDKSRWTVWRLTDCWEQSHPASVSSNSYPVRLRDKKRPPVVVRIFYWHSKQINGPPLCPF